jgi:magnesium-protoporphyrin O-methyltransferase
MPTGLLHDEDIVAGPSRSLAQPRGRRRMGRVWVADAATVAPMTSCQCDRIESRFDEAYASEKLDAYRASGPDSSTRALIEALCMDDLEGMTLLDIGGGVGAVQHALLKAGVRSAQEVEASAAYGAACRDEAQRQGHADRITHFVGDFASVADQLEPADIVTLDRSLCCWHDMPSLVGRSATMASRLYGLVYPRDDWWVRFGWRIFSDFRHLAHRNPMHVYMHRRQDVESLLAAKGLAPRSYSEVGVWRVVTFARTPVAPDA